MKETNDSMCDLSNFGNPISTLFEQPKNATEWEQYVLSKEQVEFFNENGYLSGIKILNDKILNINSCQHLKHSKT